MAGLYFHIPFCARACTYCNFAKQVGTMRSRETFDAMHRELHERRGFLSDKYVRTIYFGGGTPSLFGADVYEGFLRDAASVFDCSTLEETTLEANPDDMTPQYAESLLRVGIDRLSIGVQSFDDGTLRFMNRRHDSRAAKRAVEDARAAGFGNITIDIIFGVGAANTDALRRTLDTALSLSPEHVSAYHLTVEDGTRLGRMVARGEYEAVSEERGESEYMLVHETLSAAGYEHYEVSNYARAGFRARHNSAYWSGEEYLGIGAGAHSYNGLQRCWSSSSVGEYIAGRGAGGETLSTVDKANERIMVSLRCAEGIDTARFEADFGGVRLARLLASVEPFVASGTVVASEGRLRIPAEKFMVSDYVIESLFALE